MVVGQRNDTAMPPRDRAHQAQPEPVAGRAPARLQPNESTEHVLAIGGRDPWTAIGDFDQCAPPAPSHLDRDLAAVPVFESIVEQVGDRLRQQVAIAVYNRAGQAVEMQPETFVLDQRLI